MSATENNSKIHTTIGVYPTGDMKLNGVKEENLEMHIEYNIQNRWGRALFVDGKCVHKGGLDALQIHFHEMLFKSDCKYTLHKDTAPYH